MTIPSMNKLSTVFPIMIEKYEQFIPNIEGMGVPDKINAIIQYLNRIGKLSNDVVADWNKVMVWVMDEGLTDAINAKVDDMASKGTLDGLLQPFLDEINTANNSFQTSVNTQILGKANQSDVTSLSNKRKRKTRKDGTYKITKFTFPSTFGWQDAPINIFTDGIKYFTDFDVAKFKNVSTNTYWVDPVNGVNTNTGTSSAPFLTIEKAYITAVAGDTIMLKDGVYFRDRSWQTVTAVKKNLNIIAQNKGGAVIPFCDRHTYTLTSGNVYQVARSNVRDVLDFTFQDWGYKYTKATSITDCQNKIGSWYSDGTTLYVHSLTGGIPDYTKVYPVLQGIQFKASNDTSNVSLYLEGVSIIGGDYGVWCDRISATNQMSVYGKSLKILYTTGNDGNADCINADGVDYAFFQDCVAGFSNKDGFNYTANNSATTVNAPKFIEVNCIGVNNGLTNSVVGSENTNNGSTCHNGTKGIRLNCTYYGNMGSNLCDVQTGTQTLNFSPTVYDPKSGTLDLYDTNICTQQAGAEMWVYGAVTFGAAFDVYAVTGSTIHIYDSEFESKNGGGVMEIVNQI
jgi:hypothetical protein